MKIYRNTNTLFSNFNGTIIHGINFGKEVKKKVKVQVSAIS